MTGLLWGGYAVYTVSAVVVAVWADRVGTPRRRGRHRATRGRGGWAA